MNLIQSLIATGTIALVSLTSLPIALPETSNPAPITSESSQVMAELPASFQPGLNRAQRLADRGFAAFSFDFRYWGESGGAPRQYESPAAKVQDIKNAVAFLKTLPVIDSDRIGGLGICASAGYMAQAVAEDASFKSFATVAAWLWRYAPRSRQSVAGKPRVARLSCNKNVLT